MRITQQIIGMVQKEYWKQLFFQTNYRKIKRYISHLWVFSKERGNLTPYGDIKNDDLQNQTQIILL